MSQRVAAVPPETRRSSWPWIFATAAVLVVGLVGAFAVYTWGGWRGTDSDDDEAALARLYAIEYATAIGVPLTDITRVAPGHWRVQWRSEGALHCTVLDLERFRVEPVIYEGYFDTGEVVVYGQAFVECPRA